MAKAEIASFNITDLNKFGQNQADALKAVQHEMTTFFEESRKACTERIELEQKLTAELFSNLSQAKSVPDGTKVYQDWMGKHLELWAEDGQRLGRDLQKLYVATSRIYSGIGQAH